MKPRLLAKGGGRTVAFRSLLIAFVMMAVALISVLGFHATSASAAGKENVTDINVPADEVILASEKTGPTDQVITQADYDKFQDQYNVSPNGPNTITSKTSEVQSVESETKSGTKKNRKKTTTTWVMSGPAEQNPTVSNGTSQENPTQTNDGWNPALLFAIPAVAAPLATPVVAGAIALPAVLAAPVVAAVPVVAAAPLALAAPVVAVAAAAPVIAVPAVATGLALNAVPAALTGAALNAIPAALTAGTALNLLPAALAAKTAFDVGKLAAAVPAIALNRIALGNLGAIHALNNPFSFPFGIDFPSQAARLLKGFINPVPEIIKDHIEDILVPAALAKAALDAIPVALAAGALLNAVPVAALVGIPALAGLNMLGKLAGDLAKAIPVVAVLSGLHVLNKLLPIIPAAFILGSILSLDKVLPILIPVILVVGGLNGLLKTLPVVIPLALILGGIDALNKALPVLLPIAFAIGTIHALNHTLGDALKLLPIVLGTKALKDFNDNLKKLALLGLANNIGKKLFNDFVVKPLALKTAFDLLIRNPLLAHAIRKALKRELVRGLKKGAKLTDFLNKKALNDFVIKPLLAAKALNDLVVKPLLGAKALKNFNDFVVKPLAAFKALRDFNNRIVKPLVALKALNDFVVKPLLALKALNDFVIKPLVALKALNDFVVKPLLALKALNDLVVKPLLFQRALLGLLGALNALNNPLSFGDPLFRLVKGFAFPLNEISKNLLQDLVELALRNLGALHALVNPLSLGGPLWRLGKGFLFPLTEITKDHLEDLANLTNFVDLKNHIDWLNTNLELLKALRRFITHPPVILSQVFILGKPLFELNRDVIAFVVLDAVGQLLFPFSPALGINFIRQITEDLYKITRANINIMLFEALIDVVAVALTGQPIVPIVPTAFLSGVQQFEHMEEMLARTFIDREIAGFLFAAAVSALLLPVVGAVDGLVTLALLQSAVFPLIQGTINFLQNLQSIARILLFGNGWLITNLELLKVFNNLPVIITQVFIIGKLAAELVRNLVAFTGIDIVLQVLFLQFLQVPDFIFHFVTQAVVDFSEMAFLHAYILPYMMAEHIGLDFMRTIVDKELFGFAGASLITLALLQAIVPLDILGTVLINGNPLTHLI